MSVSNKMPIAVEVISGKTYYWCACGLSQNQPFCDGSHKTTSISPVKFESDSDKTVYFCGCKKTGNAPLCDGSHNKI